MSTDRYFDPDPRPRRSPRLYGEMGNVDLERPADRRAKKLTPGQRAKLRRNLAIHAARKMGMSFGMLSVTFHISKMQVKRICDGMGCAKSRV